MGCMHPPSEHASSVQESESAHFMGSGVKTQTPSGVHASSVHATSSSHQPQSHSSCMPAVPHARAAQTTAQFATQRGVPSTCNWHACPGGQSPQVPPHPSPPHSLPTQAAAGSQVASASDVGTSRSDRSEPGPPSPETADSASTPSMHRPSVSGAASPSALRISGVTDSASSCGDESIPVTPSSSARGVG